MSVTVYVASVHRFFCQEVETDLLGVRFSEAEAKMLVEVDTQKPTWWDTVSGTVDVCNDIGDIVGTHSYDDGEWHYKVIP